LPPQGPALLPVVRIRSLAKRAVDRQKKRPAFEGGPSLGEVDEVDEALYWRSLPCETALLLAERALASPPMLTALLTALCVVGALLCW
jgi:hypothetical protein